MLRGVNGENLFNDDQDRVRFCFLMQDGCEKHKVAIHGFCLMSNHIHLILEALKDTFSFGIHAFSFKYAQYFNERYERKGYLFQGRFKSIVIMDDVYTRHLIRYIHLNPVKANIVQVPEKYTWSSYRAYLGYDRFPWLNTERILRQFGNTKNEAIDRLVAHTALKIDLRLDESIIAEALRRGVYGDDDDERFPEVITPSDRKDATPPLVDTRQLSLSILVEDVCNHFSIDHKDLLSENKSKRCVDARSVLALFSRETKLWSLDTLGEFMGKNKGTLSRLATRAEDFPELYALVNKLKTQIKS